MSVTHLKPVWQFIETLQNGGHHAFEITGDEMPGIEDVVGIDEGVKVLCMRSSPAARKTTWMMLLDQLAEKGASCVYRRVGRGVYRVACIVPSPAVDAVASHTVRAQSECRAG